MRASRPLEVTVAVYPTLVLTNALPYDMDIVVWQVSSSRICARANALPKHELYGLAGHAVPLFVLASALLYDQDMMDWQVC